MGNVHGANMKPEAPLPHPNDGEHLGGGFEKHFNGKGLRG